MMPAFAQYIHIAARVKPEPQARPQCGETGKGPTTEQKLALVDKWKRSGMTKVDFCKLHGMHVGTLRDWAAGRSLAQRGMNNLTDSATRNRALELYRGGMTARPICKAMNIPENTVRGWITAWRHEGLV